MKLNDILKAYQDNSQLFDFSEAIRKGEGEKFHIKGLAGSQPAFLIAALWRQLHRSIVVILNDREEALYFHNDLQQVLPKKEIFFPASYKRPYQLEEIDNANVLQRAEVLNELNQTQTGRQVLVTFAEALNEKVVNKRSLVDNTLKYKVGERVELDSVVDFLEEMGFEREDFVYEPGQYAVRGGLIDVFSFAHDLPYRIEFFDDEIESIRTFDPVSQMSEETSLKQVAIIPNVQRNLLMEEKVSFLEYISASTLVFTRSIDFVHADIERLYTKAEKYFGELQDRSRGAAASMKPGELYYSGDRFLAELKSFSVVEFANKTHYRKQAATLEWKGAAQPQFNKEFTLLAQHLKDNEQVAINNFVFSSNPKQLQRLEEIFTEIDPDVHFTGIDSEVHEGFSDGTLRIAVYTDHQIFNRYHRFKVRSAKERSQAITLKELRELTPGDFVTHISHGIGKFAGLHTIQVGEHTQDAVKIIYDGGDAIFVNVNALHKIAKYTGKEGTDPKLSKLGSNAWARSKAKAKTRIKELAFDLVDLYAKRKATLGYSFSSDDYLQRELEASFMFEDTPDQEKTTEEVKADMAKPFPMDRLVCGDVGFGKTEIAVRAAFKAAINGKQTAVLVPTTILALQHYKTFKARLAEFPVKVDYVNRFKSAQETKETLRKVAAGEIDILIGTHRIVSKDVIFKDLGLMIVDEEQRFGVNVKEKFKTMKTEIDTLTLTATPIPRTLQFSLLNIRDLSVIQTPPPNRQPIDTIVVAGFDQETVRDAVAYELKRGGQVYFIHPRVQDIEEVASSVKKLVPDARIAVAHGQLSGPKLEKVMTDFIEGAFDVLVATKIVESGLDIPNANTVIINKANMYGLAELHQMRGRVGRSNRKAFCYLLAPPDISLTDDARKRLKAMEEFTDLGSGFHIALRDLDIRGSGDLLGPDQSGFIAEIGYDVYHRILDEAIRELKAEQFGDLFAEEIQRREAILVEDCQIDLDLDIRIPQHYIASTSERLNLYRRIAGADKEEERMGIMKEMMDRFGPLPQEVLNLFDTARIRQAAIRIGIEKISLKQDKLRFFFVSDHESIFYKSHQFERLMEFLVTYSAKVKLKETPKYLSMSYNEPMTHVKQVLGRVEELHDFLTREKVESGKS